MRGVDFRTQDYGAIARDVADGRVVAVFCDSMRHAERDMVGVHRALREMGEEPVTRVRDHTVGVDGKGLAYFASNEMRGLSADAAYLSDSARYQLWFREMSEGHT